MLSRTKKFLNDVYPLIMDPDNTYNIIAGLITTGASTAANFLMPYTLGQLSGQISKGTTSVQLFGITMDPYAAISILGGSFLLSYELPTVRSMFLSHLAPDVTKKLLKRYVEHHLDQSLDHHNSVSAGTHAKLTNTCSTAIQTISNDFFTQIFPTTIEIAIATGILARWYGGYIGLTLGADIAAYTAYNIYAKNKIESAREEYYTQSEQSDIVSKSAMEQYQPLHLAKTVNYTKKQVNLSLAESALSESNYHHTTGIIQLMQNGIISAGFWGICALATSNILKGDLVAGDLVTIVTYLASIASPLSTFGSSLNDTIAAHSDLSAVFRALEVDDPIPDPYPHVPLKFNKDADIEFKNVTFTHLSKDRPTLENISFTIKAGQKAAIVGLSGSGKSTLLNLLYRDYAPDSGQIFIGGQDINECSLRELREYITCVVQQPRFPNDTVFNIVASGAGDKCEEVTEAQVEKALSMALLLEDVNKLPNKTNEMVGENGCRLSGGQKQRLAIARGLIRPSDLIIFDEATSALDSKTEHAVQQQMDAIHKTLLDSKANPVSQQRSQNTMLFITHHLNTITNADTIIVLNKGKVIQGTHAELLADSKSEYAQLWEQQHTLPHPRQHQAQLADDKKHTSLIPYSARHTFLPPPVQPPVRQQKPNQIELVILSSPKAAAK